MTSETDTSILIIDDAPESQIALKKLLRPKYRVLAATPGADGLRVTGNLPKPDLIPPDVMMPDMDSFEVLTQLHDNPAIFLTALANICDDGLGKPFDPDLVDAFLAGFDDFVAIAKRYIDAGPMDRGERTNAIYRSGRHS